MLLPAFKRGYPGFSFASFPFSPVHAREPNRFLRPGYEWSPWYAIFPDGWQDYDYFLVHGKPRPPTSESLERLELVASAGAWSLYAGPTRYASLSRGPVSERRRESEEEELDKLPRAGNVR